LDRARAARVIGQMIERDLDAAAGEQLDRGQANTGRCAGHQRSLAFEISHRTLRSGHSSVPIPKFAHPCGSLECELRNQRDTSNSMILVPLLNPKFASALAARYVRTSGSRQ